MSNNNYEPIVSIIMGAYNCAHCVKQCIDSILNQTYTAWEFIICDDCSTDNTLQVLKKYSEMDTRIRIIRNDKNMRLAASLNNCLKIARGKYVARMDADDYSLPKRLATQVAFLDQHDDVDVVGCNREVFDEEGIRGIRTAQEYPEKKRLLFNPPFAHPTIMMRRTVYNALNGYSTDIATMRAEDLDLWFRFFAAGYRGYNIQEVLYGYHESKQDYKKRTLEAAIHTTEIYIRGYKLLKVPAIYYVFALKPIISAAAPRKLIEGFHRKSDSKCWQKK